MYRAFAHGAVSGSAIVLGFLIAWHSVPALRDGDWQFFAVQFLGASCIGAGGVVHLLTVLEYK